MCPREDETVRTAKRSFRMFASIAIVAMAVVVTTVSMSEAWGGRYGYGGGRYYGSRVFVGVGIGVPYAYPYPYWRPYYNPYYAYPYPYYYPYPYPGPAVQESTVYIQQPPAPPPPPAPAAPPTEGYWYYCESEKGYYPTVPSCSEAWIKVPPRTQ
jgi:hypothetical protein